MLLAPQHKKSAKPSQKDQESFFKPRAQAKLKVNKPGDQHEVEADMMADTIVEKQQIAPKVSTPTPNLAQAKLDEEQVQTKLDDDEVQAKEEEEVQAMEEEEAQASEDQASAPGEPVQAMEEEEVQSKEEDEEVQAKLQNAPGIPTKPSPVDTLASTKGGGTALGGSTKAQMEQGFGTDFSNVRIHTDSRAEEMTKGAGAKAFTHKKDIYFNKGKFQPETKAGKKLIAHELTHTIQQDATPEQKPTEEQKPVSEATPESASKSSSTSAAAMPAVSKIVDAEKVDPATAEEEALVPEKEKAGGAKKDEAEGAEEIPDGPPVIRNPKANPGFKKTVTNIDTEKTAQVDLEDPEALSSKAQSSAPVASNERMGSAQANQVEEMDKAEPEEFNEETFKAMLMSRITEMQLPTNNEEADDFEDKNNIAEVNKKAVGDVNKEKAAAAGPIEQSKEKEPDTGVVAERVIEPLLPPEPGKKPGKIGAKAAVPNKRPESEVSKPIAEDTARMDNTMADNKVTDEQLEKSQEPTFQEALTEKNSAKEQAVQAPTDLRKKEKGSIRRTGAKADQKSDGQLMGMNEMRGAVLKNVAGGQKDTGTKDTGERGRVSGEINKLYAATKKEVTIILDNLETKVTTMFEKGSAQAKKIFEGYVALKMAAYKRRRYSGVSGKLKWGYDLFAGLPDEVNRYFTEGRDLFIKAMDVVITKIAKEVATELNAAKQKIQDGKQDVKNYVDDLPKELQKYGKEAADDINDKFDSLQDDVNSKQEALVDTLAQQYVESLQEVDARIEEMKEANKGLIDAVMGFIDGVIETINKLRELVNSLLEAIASVLDIIMADPIGFMADLFHGIGKGIDAFKANITKHLLGGLIGWLTGALGPMGITIPDDIFSLKGIFNLVMQVLGLGWDYLRLKAVKMMGEKVVGTLEKGWDVFKIFATKGIDGIWEYLKSTFSDIKETVLDAIQGMLITQVIEAGIKWLLSLLIPGAGFIKAIMAIKDVIVFFVESAIMLIPAIIEAILALAAGSIAGVGKAIEKGLSMLLPLVINLFAKLIGLGGLAKRVMKIFKKIRKRIDKAVNKILAKAKKAGRKLMRKLGIGKKKKKKKKGGKDDRTPAEMKADLAAAKKESNNLLKDGITDKKSFKKKLSTIAEKYDLKKLEIVKKGADFEIVGKINPEFRYYAEKVTILTKDGIEAQQEEELEYFYRAISMKELEGIKRSQKIKPRSRPDGSQKGEFGLTTNKEYTVNNIIYSKANKNVNTKLAQANAKKAKYVVLIEIAVPKGTQAALRDKFGRQHEGQEGHPLTSSLPVHTDKTNTITMKVETIRGGGENVNYMINSVSPDNIEQGDPLFDINNQIKSVKIVGGIIDP